MYVLTGIAFFTSRFQKALQSLYNLRMKSNHQNMESNQKTIYSKTGNVDSQTHL